MDVRLLRDPHKAGLKVDEELRQLIIGPLAILYVVSNDDKLVRVLDVDEMP